LVAAVTHAEEEEPALLKVGIQNDSDSEISVLMRGAFYQQEPSFAGPVAILPGESVLLELPFDAGRQLRYNIVETESMALVEADNINLGPGTVYERQLVFGGSVDPAPRTEEDIPFAAIRISDYVFGSDEMLSGARRRIFDVAADLGIEVPSSFRRRRSWERYISVGPYMVKHASLLRAASPDLAGFPIIVNSRRDDTVTSIRLGEQYRLD
jgi:hypothetical protein